MEFWDEAINESHETHEESRFIPDHARMAENRFMVTSQIILTLTLITECHRGKITNVNILRYNKSQFFGKLNLRTSKRIPDKQDHYDLRVWSTLDPLKVSANSFLLFVFLPNFLCSLLLNSLLFLFHAEEICHILWHSA